MTVKQLIEFLKQYPEETVVQVSHYPNDTQDCPVMGACLNSDGSITLE